MTIQVSSAAFAPGAPIPKKHTGEGPDVSPPLSWTGLPAGTKELALVCDDPDAPQAEPWVHWVLYKLPPALTGLKEGDAGGGLQGVTDFGRARWNGPMPPRGHGVHHYHFKVFALDRPLDVKSGLSKNQLLAAMKGRLLDQGELVGTYERK